MPIIDTVSRDIIDATKARDSVRLGALRMLKAALLNKEVEKGRALEDADALQVVAALIKQRRDSIEQFDRAGRKDLADKERAEIAVLEPMLPPQVDAAELARVIDEAIAETGASSPKDLGKVMKAAMARLAGKTVDGKAVSDLARQKLTH